MKIIISILLLYMIIYEVQYDETNIFVCDCYKIFLGPLHSKIASDAPEVHTKTYTVYVPVSLFTVSLPPGLLVNVPAMFSS